MARLICSFNAALRSAQEGLRRSEINFRSLVTNAPYGICRCDSDGILLDVNPALVAMLGYASARNWSAAIWPICMPTRNSGSAWPTTCAPLEKFQGLCDWMRKDRAPISVRLSGRAIRDEDNAIFFELFAEDVTERRALEEQLRQAQKMEASAAWPAASPTTSTTSSR